MVESLSLYHWLHGWVIALAKGELLTGVFYFQDEHISAQSQGAKCSRAAYNTPYSEGFLYGVGVVLVN